MNVIFSDKARTWTEGGDLLQGATRGLEEVVGKHSPDVNAEWDRIDDEKGSPLYTLKIANGTDFATTSFTKADLESKYHLRMGLLRLWDKLLQKRLDDLLQKMGED